MNFQKRNYYVDIYQKDKPKEWIFAYGSFMGEILESIEENFPEDYNFTECVIRVTAKDLSKSDDNLWSSTLSSVGRNRERLEITKHLRSILIAEKDKFSTTWKKYEDALERAEESFKIGDKIEKIRVAKLILSFLLIFFLLPAGFILLSDNILPLINMEEINNMLLVGFLSVICLGGWLITALSFLRSLVGR